MTVYYKRSALRFTYYQDSLTNFSVCLYSYNYQLKITYLSRDKYFHHARYTVLQRCTSVAHNTSAGRTFQTPGLSFHSELNSSYLQYGLWRRLRWDITYRRHTMSRKKIRLPSTFDSWQRRSEFRTVLYEFFNYLLILFACPTGPRSLT